MEYTTLPYYHAGIDTLISLHLQLSPPLFKSSLATLVLLSIITYHSLPLITEEHYPTLCSSSQQETKQFGLLRNDKRKEIAQQVPFLPGIFAPLCRELALQPLWSWSGAAQDSAPHMYLVPAQKFLLWNQAVLTLQFLGDWLILHGWWGVDGRHRRRGRDRSHGRSRDKGWNGWGHTAQPTVTP